MTKRMETRRKTMWKKTRRKRKMENYEKGTKNNT